MPFKRARSSLFPRLACACLLAALVACGEEEPAPTPPRVVLVEPLLAVEPQPLEWRFPAVVESLRRTELAFEVDGRLESMLVAQGERVEQGQALAELDRTDYELQLREATARHQQLEADLERRRLLLAEGIIAPAAIEALEAEVVAARVARENAARALERSTLNAPFEGVVARRLVQQDMVVAAGTPVFEMQAGGEEIEVGVDLPEAAALRLPLDARLEAEGVLVADEARMPLAYQEHSTQPQQGGRTYRLILRGVPPEGYNLLPGMAMRVTLRRPPITDESREDLFRVPLTALQSAEEGGYFLWMVEEGHARRRDLRVERIAEDQAVVAGDLIAGTPVVVAGGRQVSEGQAVRVSERD